MLSSQCFLPDQLILIPSACRRTKQSVGAEMASLIGVKHLRLTVASEHRFQDHEAELCANVARELSAENSRAEGI